MCIAFDKFLIQLFCLLRFRFDLAKRTNNAMVAKTYNNPSYPRLFVIG